MLGFKAASSSLRESFQRQLTRCPRPPHLLTPHPRLLPLQLGDVRESENRLVSLLDFERFALIKELLTSRERIVWCTRLARAQDEGERGAIEAEMEGAPGTAAILAALHATRASARDRQTAVERNIREEARKLRAGGGADGASGGSGGPSGGAGAGPGAAAGRKNVDLENLTFAAGSHFNSAKSCTLPAGSYRTVHKGYEEVHVPALKPKPFADGAPRGGGIVGVVALCGWVCGLVWARGVGGFVDVWVCWGAEATVPLWARGGREAAAGGLQPPSAGLLSLSTIAPCHNPLAILVPLTLPRHTYSPLPSPPPIPAPQARSCARSRSCRPGRSRGSRA